MTGLTIETRMLRRRAEITLKDSFIRRNLKITDTSVTTVPCFMLGIFQEQEDGDANPIMVCELFDGTVCSVYPTYVKFVDTTGEGIIL